MLRQMVVAAIMLACRWVAVPSRATTRNSQGLGILANHALMSGSMGRRVQRPCAGYWQVAALSGRKGNTTKQTITDFTGTLSQSRKADDLTYDSVLL